MTDWNPLLRRDEVEHEVPGSGGTAHAYARPWSGAERIAYEDTMTTRVLPDDGIGLRMGTLELVHATLTLTRAVGFPNVGDVPFDPRVEAHLTALDVPTFTDLVRFAQRVQPIPRGDVEDPTPDPTTAAPAGKRSRKPSTRPDKVSPGPDPE